jgi:16S rRNA (cytosine1402-N4)-methyltransferase
MSDYHTPVMLRETLEYLHPRSGGVYVDATLGGGGYSGAILPFCQPGGRVIGIDQDPDALAEASRRLSEWRDAFLPLRGNFREMDALLRQAGIARADGAVFDLGVSSHQLNAGERGFSFRYDAPLDMRMDPIQGDTAADLVNTLPEKELTRIIREYGEENWAARIAKFVVEARARGPLRTTGDLVRVIESAVPKAARPKEIHAATRTFQALRIAVNGELDALEQGLSSALECLSAGGRIVVISYHSLEDRIVKNRFQSWEKPCVCPPGLPVCGCGKSPSVGVVTRKPVSPTGEEVVANPRSRSARLRCAEKL